MKIIRIGDNYKFCDDSLKTYDTLPVGTYTFCFSEREGCFLSERSSIHVDEKVYGNHEEKAKKVMRAFS